MDRHAPWVKNCWFSKHQIFFDAGDDGTLPSSGVGYSTAWVPSCTWNNNFCSEHHVKICELLSFVVFGFLALGFLGVLSPMLAQHAYLAMMNASTMKHHYDNMPNLFDMSSTLPNLEQIFGIFGQAASCQTLRPATV